MPAVKVRSSGRKAAALVAKPAFIEVRGVHMYSYPDRIVVSDGIYTTYRYRDRLAAAGGSWDGAAWTFPIGTDVCVALSPPAANRPSWTCCPEAKVLNHKSQHYSCQKHTMYWEECMGADGQPIKILYSCSTRGGGCYTGN